MRLTKKIESFLVALSILLKLTSFSFTSLAHFSLLADFGLFLFFASEIPTFLNRFYRTQAFTEKGHFRMVIPLSFVAVFLVFAFLGSDMFLSVFFGLGETPLNNIGNIFFSIFLGMLISILGVAIVFSLLVRKHPELAIMMISRRSRTNEDVNLALYELKGDAVARALCFYEIGIMLSGMIIFLFALWMLFWALDIVFVAILLVWLANNLFSLKDLRIIDRILKGINSSQDAIDSSVGWKGFTKPILGGVKAASISLITIFCFLMYASFIIGLAGSPADLFRIMVVFCFWYLVALIFILSLRLNREFYLLRNRHHKVLAILLPPKADILVVLVSVIVSMAVFLVYFPAYVIFGGSALLLILSTITNVLAGASMAWFLLFERKRRDTIGSKSFVHDRIRMVAIAIPVILLYSTVGEAPIILGIALLMILSQVYSVDLKHFIEDKPAGIYAAVESVYMFLTIAVLALLIDSFPLGPTHPLVGVGSKILVCGIVVTIIGGIVAYYGQFIKQCMIREKKEQIDSAS